MPMAEVEQFSYGVANPFLASVVAYVGYLLSLVCTAGALTVTARGRRAAWLLACPAAIGGAGLRLMHMMAMLGFDVEGSQIRFNPWLVSASLALAIIVVAAGMFLVAFGPRSTPRLLIGGLLHRRGRSALHRHGRG